MDFDALIPVAGMLLTGSLFFMGYRVVMYRMRRDDTTGMPPELEREVARLKEEVALLRDVQDRVVELEERLDFTERILAREREQARLPGEGD